MLKFDMDLLHIRIDFYLKKGLLSLSENHPGTVLALYNFYGGGN